jgi:MFS family permease
LIVVVDILGLTMILPLLPFYAEHYGATPFVVGFLASSYAVCQLISGPLLGRASDRIGRKPLLLLSQAGTFIGFLILANANSLALVFLSRVIDGATAGNLSLAQAYISDVTAPKDRAKSFAVIGIAFGIGFLVGPGVSGYLAHFGLRYPVFMAAALSATSILATTFLLPSKPQLPEGVEPEKEKGPAAPGGERLALLDWGAYLQYLRRPVLGGLLAQFFVFTLSFASFTNAFSLFAERRFTWDDKPFDAEHVGYVFAYVGFLGIILQGGLIGRLVKRFGEPALIWAGFFSMAGGYIALGFTYHVPMLLAVATFSSFGNGALRPALTSLITQSVSRSEQGVVLGLNQSLNSISQIVAPPLAGFLIDHGQLGPWAWMAGTFAAFGLLLAPRGSAAFARNAASTAASTAASASAPTSASNPSSAVAPKQVDESSLPKTS